MLGSLFGSNARVKILKLFLLHPSEKYYIRQLARDLKLQVNSVRRELENLEKFGLLISNISTGSNQAEAGDKEAQFSDSEMVVGGLDSLAILKKSRALRKVRSGPAQDRQSKQEKKYYQANKNFVLFEEVKALIIKAQILYEKDFIEKLKRAGNAKLFVLTGFFINSSDAPTDMLLVGRFNKNKLFKLIKELEKELGRELNFTLMDTKEFKYRRDITDIFLYGILEGRKIVVIDEIGVG